MKNTNKIKEMSWTEFDERRGTTDTVIIPLGAVEVYGPHMPLGSDSIVAGGVADIVAQRVNVVISPTLEPGESTALFTFPGTIVMRPDTVRAVVTDLLDSLMHWGFKKFLFINGHAGNVAPVTQVCNEYTAKYGIRCAQVDWWRFVKPYCEGICEYDGWMAHGHAAESGTSIMMYLHPEYVGDYTCQYSALAPKFQKFPNFVQYERNDFENGMIGDARVATKEKGRLIVNRCVDAIVEFLVKDFGCTEYVTGDAANE